MAEPTLDPDVTALHTFWFETPTPEIALPAPRKAWFVTDPDFDEALRQRFGHLVVPAREGRLAAWEEHPRSLLALLLVLDQLPRNLFRTSGDAFASDATARAVASRALARGVDQALPWVARLFLYLPFEHSEELGDQERAVSLFAALEREVRERLPPEDPLVAWVAMMREYADKHHAVIARFGRFPHRNAMLERVTTAEEAAFMAREGRGF